MTYYLTSPSRTKLIAVASKTLDKGKIVLYFNQFTFLFCNFFQQENIENNNLPKPQVEEEPKESGDVSGTYTFKSMYNALPSNVSTNMAKNLSTPIAFVCLLYLANEKVPVVFSLGRIFLKYFCRLLM